MSNEKRMNYSEEEDVMLLRKVLGDRPFLAQRGKIIGAWDAFAAKLLVKTRRNKDEENMANSGVSEAKSERALRLKGIDRARRRPHNDSVCAAKGADTLKRQQEEKASATAGRLVMEKLGKTRERSPPGKRLKREELLKDKLLELKEKELQDKREPRELMAPQRKEDRAHKFAVVQAVLSIVDLIRLRKKN
ncbi:hypothetical protein F444_10462 [Phytophthora nicotianae P1976]|uniref:Uncharacterized protein n=1 Tax=Phytophthora nicotianae P1976 TaxID=1317066 RepID=A0A081A3Y5_PHYNI|nr:hypothetical protein F444_10462 [Phytophthora nicotianae P1976]